MMEILTSRKNVTIQRVRKLLSSRKARVEEGLFVADGTKLLAEAVKWWPGLKMVLHTPEIDPEVPAYVEKICISRELMEYVSPMETPQGALFVCALPEEKGGTAKYLGVRRVYRIAGKTGTAEIGTDKSKELAWFIGFRSCYKETGEEVAAEEQRLVLVMLEIDMKNPPEEYTLMKFKIARELLKDDNLTKPGLTETAITG